MFRKRMKYAFEREWSSLRLLRRLEAHEGGIFLSPFDRPVRMRSSSVLTAVPKKRFARLCPPMRATNTFAS
jgi:hypothetical protein